VKVDQRANMLTCAGRLTGEKGGDYQWTFVQNAIAKSLCRIRLTVAITAMSRSVLSAGKKALWLLSVRRV
jgi:hypothetical protein